jgi:hypothetical protein
VRAAIPDDGIFFARAKVTVRVKDAPVNSVFLVQLRKKVEASLAVEGTASSADGKRALTTEDTGDAEKILAD